MRIGLIGYGGFGRFLHGAWDALDGVRVAAVADPALDDGALGPDVGVHRDAADLISRDDLDLVAIATPPSTHAALALSALRRGRSVLVEKPLALTPGEVNALERAAAESGAVVAVDYMQRFTRTAEALAAWADAGTFGAFVRMVVENDAQDEALPRHHWFWDEAVSGGILVEHAVHFIDLAHRLLPPDDAPVQVAGGQAVRDDGRVDRVWLGATYASGATVLHAHAFTRPTRFERTTLRFVFERAEVTADGWLPMRGEVRALVRGADDEAALARLPGFTATHREDLGGRALAVGGHGFAASHEVHGTFDEGRPKSDVYADALRALLIDVRAAMETPGHRLRAGVAEARRSLDVALRARASAHADDRPG